MKYPTRNHLAVSTEELDLPESELNLDKRKSWHNHHLYYYSGRYKPSFIMNSLRNLESSQEMLPRDVHVLGKLALHNVYTDGVPLPPAKVAMERLEEGFENGERFKVWNVKKKRYEFQEFDRGYWEALKRVYNAYDE